MVGWRWFCLLLFKPTCKTLQSEALVTENVIHAEYNTQRRISALALFGISPLMYFFLSFLRLKKLLQWYYTSRENTMITATAKH